MKTQLDFKNDLLKRREVKLIVESAGNPGYDQALKTVADHFKSPSENIVVNHVNGKFGRKTFLIDAFIYHSKEDRERVERKPKVKKAEGAAPAA